ncbi:MAG: AmmeMemoRadiSam system protein A [Desulfobulbaceae bacterium]|nr:MAG: AmmeMemoRadiSam system protein A [Desulfobulbaceae bacterium]
MTEKINVSVGKALLEIARRSIGKQLGLLIEQETQPEGEIFFQEYATFVTLKLNNQLRGCIGNLAPSGSLLDSVTRNAINAAFHDHRFSPLELKEFDQVEIDISVLGKPNKIDYQSAADLIDRLTPGVDGVILELGRARATFLPQVWQQLPDPISFLTQLCLKAGLPANCWKTDKPDIYLYQVKSFSE